MGDPFGVWKLQPQGRKCYKRGRPRNAGKNEGGGMSELFSTPTAAAIRGSGMGKGLKPLNKQVQSFPTPCAHDAMAQSGKPHGWMKNGKECQRNLNDEVKRIPGATYPTPRTMGMCGGSGAFAKMGELVEAGVITEDDKRKMTAGNGGQLNPDWVEWLMGWFIGWTDLECENDALRVYPINNDPAEYGLMERTTTRRDQRIARIKENGNGQVPLCAAAAMAALAGILEGLEDA